MLYRSYYSRRHKEMGYSIITARRSSGFGAKNNFLISGYGVRESRDKWDFKFSMPDSGTVADALIKAIEGYESPNSTDWRRPCTIQANTDGIVPFIPANQIGRYRDQIADLKAKLKQLGEDTTQLDAAIAEAQALEKSLQAERTNSANLREAMQVEKDKFESQLRQMEAQTASLEAALADAQANTPETYAQTALELAKAQKALQSSERKAAQMEGELRASKQLINDLMALADEKSAESEALNARLASFADANRKIANLESALTQAKAVSDDLISARDRVISSQASDIARLESLVEESRAGHASTIGRLEAEKLALEAALETSERRLQQLGEILGVSVESLSQSAHGANAKSAGPLPSWERYASSISIQQQQFCALTERFYAELKAARSTNNDIKVNLVFKNRQDDLDALVPKGQFNNWIFEVVRIEQVPDGSAAVVVKTQCDTMVGSGYLPTRSTFFGDDNKSWRATIPYEDRRFRELAKLSAGQFVTGSSL